MNSKVVAVIRKEDSKAATSSSLEQDSARGTEDLRQGRAGEEREMSVKRMTNEWKRANAKTHLIGCGENAAPEASRKSYRRVKRRGDARC